jgi:hypothetical protein
LITLKQQKRPKIKVSFTEQREAQRRILPAEIDLSISDEEFQEEVKPSWLCECQSNLQLIKQNFKKKPTSNNYCSQLNTVKYRLKSGFRATKHA